MKYLILILLIIVFVAPGYSANLITVTEVKGKVELKGPDGSWKLLKKGTTVPQGSLISTGFKSSAELDLGGSSTVFVKQLTRMSVDQLAFTGQKVNTELNLTLGRIRADVKTSEGLRHNFTLKTPVSTAAVRGTVFEGAANGDLIVEKGQMQQRNKIGQKTTVSGGNSTAVSGSGYSPPSPPAEAVAETFTVEPSTEPADAPPPVIPPPSGPPTGSAVLNWGITGPPVD